MSWFNGRNIVVPIDFGNEADGAVDVALQLAPLASSVTVIHVAPDLNVLEPGIVWGDMNDESRRENLIKSFHQRFAESKYEKLKFDVLFGDPGHRIAEYAKDSSAGLIVLPSQGRTGLETVSNATNCLCSP